MSCETLVPKGLYDIGQPYIISEQFMADKRVKGLLAS